jgi:hypothetical protein
MLVNKQTQRSSLALLAILIISCNSSTASNDSPKEEVIMSSSSITSEPIPQYAAPGSEPALNLLPWNGAQGAYSIIMDDFCAATTNSLAWAATEASNRGFGIGFAVIAGQCDEAEWEIARQLIVLGSEAINHSLRHSCADITKCNGTTPWITGSDALFSEVDSSTQLIEVNTGVRPTFFGYPFDVAHDDAQKRLQELGYLGSRSWSHRTYTSGGFNRLNMINGFRVEYDARQPANMAQYQNYEMDDYATQAASKQAWAIRETHGIDDGSYGAWTAAEFTAHLDHIAQLQTQKQLWVAPPSTVLKYVNLSQQLTWTTQQLENAWQVIWSTPADTLQKYNTNIRISIPGNWVGFQNSAPLESYPSATSTDILVDPSKGNISLYRPI